METNHTANERSPPFHVTALFCSTTTIQPCHFVSGKSKEAEMKRINKELANIRNKFKGKCVYNKPLLFRVHVELSLQANNLITCIKSEFVEAPFDRLKYSPLPFR